MNSSYLEILDNIKSLLTNSNLVELVVFNFYLVEYPENALILSIPVHSVWLSKLVCTTCTTLINITLLLKLATFINNTNILSNSLRFFLF